MATVAGTVVATIAGALPASAGARAPTVLPGSAVVRVASTGNIAGLQPPVLSPAAPPLAQISGSVSYLRRTYGVTTAEAVRRLVLQRNMPAIDTWLSRRFPGNYSGMWLDQAGGGVAVVVAVHPAALSTALSAVRPVARVRTQAARFSLRQLQRAASQLRRELGPGAGVAIDEVRNQVTVHMHGRPAAARARAAADAMMPASAHAGMISVTSYARAYSNECDPASCVPPRNSGCDQTNCTPPLRAGVNIDLWTSDDSFHQPAGRCTTGFTLNGSNGWVYSTTAGHCMDVANATSNDGYWLGYWTGGTYWNDSYPTDHAVTPFIVLNGFNYATYWFGGHHNYVMAGGNTTFPITGMYTYAQIKAGWIACASGTMTGTTCGQVTGEDGGIVTNICQHHGDSGDPLFSEIDNKAYGLQIQDPTTDDSCPAGYYSQFTPISFVTGRQDDGVTLSVATN